MSTVKNAVKNVKNFKTFWLDLRDDLSIASDCAPLACAFLLTVGFVTGILVGASNKHKED